MLRRVARCPAAVPGRPVPAGRIRPRLAGLTAQLENPRRSSCAAAASSARPGGAPVTRLLAQPGAVDVDDVRLWSCLPRSAGARTAGRPRAWILEQLGDSFPYSSRACSARAFRQPRMPKISRSATTTSPRPPMIRRIMSVWRSVDGPRGGRRRERTGSSGSSRKDSSRILSWRSWAPAKVDESMHGGQDAPRPTRKLNPNMSAPDTSNEAGTLPLGGSDPTEALPGLPATPGARPLRLERRLGAGGFGVFGLHGTRSSTTSGRQDDSLADGAEAGGREARAAARLNHPASLASTAGLRAHDVYLVSELVRANAGRAAARSCAR